MVFRKDTNVPPGNQPDDSILWDYGDDAVAFQRPRSDAPPSAAPPKPDARTIAVQRALNSALDEWWRRGVLPSNNLLRDGLLVLQAGHELDESQRTLLLRTALLRQRGVLTALRYQTDPERTAVLLEEAIFSTAHVLTAEEMRRLLVGDDRSAQWAPTLAGLLRQTAETNAEKQAVAAPILALLAGAPSLAVGETPPPSAPFPWIEGEAAPSKSVLWRRVALVILLIAAAATAVVWWQRIQQPDMVDVPAGNYPVSSWPAGEVQSVPLPTFRIDRFEVTVSQYRACYERGACPWPATSASATRPNYLLDSAFTDFPMIHIDYDSAERFCRFMGKRLPSAAEWEVAAAYAPATGRMFRFPWGDEFAPQLANSAAGIGDTMQIGSFQPAGDSSLGASDMAGNVAEWTSDIVVAETPVHLIKGGSFADQADSLRTNATATLAPRSSAAWLGVRCAADVR